MSDVRILIVEDEPIIAADLEDCLQSMGYTILASFPSGEEALAFIGQEGIPDLILMDVQLEGELNGIETARRILQQHRIPIIYLTSNTDAATFSQAKATLPQAFIGKPFRGRDLQHSIELAIDRFMENPAPTPVSTSASATPTDRIFVKDKGKLVRIYVEDISYLEADGYYCKLHTTDKFYLLTQTLKKVMENGMLLSHFLRVHRSYAVNLHQIESISDQYVHLTRQKVPIGKTYLPELRQRLRIV